MVDEQLIWVARDLVAPGKGILAADESLGTIKKRFAQISLECTEDTRRAYRHMLFSAPSIEEYPNAMKRELHPWQLSFSYARALREPALAAWRGDPANVREAQRIFLHRARCNSAARYGRYSEELEKAA